MSSMNKVRLPDGSVLEIAEWIHWPLFSTVEMAPADGINLTAFTYVRGNPVSASPSVANRNATEYDTNMLRRGKMNQDEAFIVFACTYEAFALTDDTLAPPQALAPLMGATNLRRLQRSLTYQLIIGAGTKKADIEATFSWIAQSVGVDFTVAGDSPGTYLGTAGCPYPGNQTVLNLPVPIGGTGERARPGNTRAFKLRIKCPRGIITDLTQEVRLRLILDGLRQRPS